MKFVTMIMTTFVAVPDRELTLFRLCMVAEKATLQLLIACSLFAYCISHSHSP